MFDLEWLEHEWYVTADYLTIVLGIYENHLKNRNWSTTRNALWKQVTSRHKEKNHDTVKKNALS